MSDTVTYPFTLAGNGSIVLDCVGTHFNILSSTGKVTVRMDKGGSMVGLVAGQGRKGEQFTRLTLTDASGAPNTGFIQVADDDFINQVFNGSVTILTGKAPLMTAAPTQAAANVTNASAQLLAANLTRQYLYIQNNDSVGIVYVNIAGAAATAASGIKIPPGGFIEPAVIPTTAILAIGSIANNPNVVVIEG